MTWKDGETISPLGLNRIEEAVASMNESYTPTVWQVGDVITAEKLNKIEEGIANAPSGGDFKKIEVLSVDESTNSMTLAAKVNDITGISYCVLTDEQAEAMALTDFLDNTFLLGVPIYYEDESSYYGVTVRFSETDDNIVTGYYSAATSNDNLVIQIPK